MDKIKTKITFAEMEYYLHGFGEKEIENTEIYEMVRTLSDEALPSYQDRSDTIWEGFYLPVKREGRVIALPFGIHEYNKEFFVHFHLPGNLHIKRGEKESEEFYKNIFSEALRFIPVIKADEKILEKLIPYDIRTGRIKGLYVLERVLSENSKEKILKDYARHIERNPEIREISLNEYLRTAGICYIAAYGKKTKSLSDLEMYKKWADGRDGGMLSIKERGDRKEFMDWMDSGKDAGAHPFEIVFS